MKYLTAVHADAGIRKIKNQDSVVVMEAETGAGNILFAAVCDGMGGLAKGETASAAMAQAFCGWFEDGLPVLARKMEYGSFREEDLWEQWSALITNAGCSIEEYGRSRQISLGTTAAGLLLCGSDYYTLNVGDSRVYLLSDGIKQLTRDQTYVQQEMDAGRMTYEESLTDPRRNVLLQCIGAGADVRPAFGRGKTDAGLAFLLCSDGFCHVVNEEEICRMFCPAELTGEEIMGQRLAAMTQVIKERGERDNISAVLIRLTDGKGR